ncbi:putative 26S proteasome regulatory subunit p27 [Trichinella britovi]|uniref:Putative 26S proteasome regulatory subunit p27 n=2 Tax=Trichinella TaxID=6333 RepID=A0A0V1DHU0_TRIBR|nr:putative 26S proteasome regulatory subunit p27 [Trichinella britovi]
MLDQLAFFNSTSDTVRYQQSLLLLFIASLKFTALTITRYRVYIAGGGRPRREVAETGRRADLDIASRGINAMSKWCRFGHNVTPCELSGTKDAAITPNFILGLAREKLLKLDAEKKEKCMELQRLNSELQSRGFNLGDSYVDENDYPRSDIDIPVVLNIARRIRCLQTELTDLNEKICEGLNDIHSKYIARCNNEMSAFAVVDEVLPNSTGEVMGLKKHDKLFRIGEFKVEDFESCDNIVELLENAHNMKIVIERDGQLLDIYFNGNGADVDNGLGLTLQLVKCSPISRRAKCHIV